MEHAQPLEHPASSRATAVAAGIVAVAALAGLLALGRERLFPPAHARSATPPAAKTQAAQAPPKTIVRPLRPRRQLSVLVLNGNGVNGEAGTASTRLLGKGYRRTDAADAVAPYATSLVLFRPGWEPEARRLARDAGVRLVAALDGRLPRADAGYQLVLILGAN